jgi:hypothetical protein
MVSSKSLSSLDAVRKLIAGRRGIKVNLTNTQLLVSGDTKEIEKDLKIAGAKWSDKYLAYSITIGEK